jgi:hypothetical protein
MHTHFLCQAQPFPAELLRHYVRSAQAKGVLVCADEIM